jgi:hypothetical protein
MFGGKISSAWRTMKAPMMSLCPALTMVATVAA